MCPLNCVSTGGARGFSESIILFFFFGPLSIQPYVAVRWPGLVSVWGQSSLGTRGHSENNLGSVTFGGTVSSD